jgi:carboxylesterase type B
VEKKVTVFGESAGALSTSYHYLNENFTAVARAAVRTCLSDKVTLLQFT